MKNIAFDFGNRKRELIPAIRMEYFTMITLKKRLSIILIAVILFSQSIVVEAKEEKDEYSEGVYTVSTRANFREKATKNSRWIMTIPTGVFVMIDGKEDNSYYHARYGAYEGYIYKGCIEKNNKCTYSSYREQFPELFKGEAHDSKAVAKDSKKIKTVSVPGAFISSYLNTESDDTEAEAAKEEPVQSEMITVVALAETNIRNAPSAEGKKIGIIPNGDSLTVIDGGDNGYAHIKYKDIEGYVYIRCISLNESMLAENGGIIGTVVVDDIKEKSSDISYASGASALSMRRHVLASYASEAMDDEKEAVSDEEKEIKDDEPKEVKEVEVETPSMQKEKSTAVLESLASSVIGRSTTLRSLPDSDSNKITTISVGKDVTVLGASEGGYTMVQYDGMIGYVLEDCVVDSVDIKKLGGTPTLFTVTAYCPCQKCCGSYSPEVRGGVPHTATGTIPAEGRTIAVDPSVIPYGTSVYIDGYGTFVAEDCGGGVKGNHIDMYFENHEAACNFGSQRLYCTVVQ